MRRTVRVIGAESGQGSASGMVWSLLEPHALAKQGDTGVLRDPYVATKVVKHAKISSAEPVAEISAFFHFERR